MEQDYLPPMTPYLRIIHSDDAVIVVDKQAGLLSVPGRKITYRDCLASRVQTVWPEARIVHRLDMETSGLMVLGVGADHHRNLSRQFEQRLTDKTYIARVWGHIEQDSGSVDLPLMRDWPNRPRQKVDLDAGKPSLTHWKVMSRDERTTLVELTPITGRSHQLRVHMLHLGHPILGDSLYATEDALSASDRLLLHAQTLSFTHPHNAERVTWVSESTF